MKRRPVAKLVLGCAVVLLGTGMIARLACAADRDAEREETPYDRASGGEEPLYGDESGGAQLLTFGTAPEQFWVVQHGELLSIWADHMPADRLLDELRAIGGPTYSSKQPLTRPVTISFHRARIEDVLRRMLDGFNYAYYYEDGRLAHVKVLEMIPGRAYKVGSPIETRSQWTRRVLGRTQD